MTITKERYDWLKEKQAVYDAWAEKFRVSNRMTIIPAGEVPPVDFTNDHRAEIEIYEFLNNKPKKYSFYVDMKNEEVTTWTGKVLGNITKIDNTPAGNHRMIIHAINGVWYKGCFYPKHGDYINVKEMKI